MRIAKARPTPQVETPTVATRKHRGRGLFAILRFLNPFRLLKAAPLVILLLLIAAAVLATTLVPKRFNILVVGSDQRSTEDGRSDVLMVVSLTKSPKDAISIITIPRDTRVAVEGHGMQKITHAYAFDVDRTDGKTLGNIALTKGTVEDFLHITINGTLEVTFDSFQAIIDNLGGVTTPTYGKLTGEQALKKVRDRYREGDDFARTADQREIFTQVLRTIRTQNAFKSVYAYLQDSSDSRTEIPTTRLMLFSAYAYLRRGGHFSLEGSHQDVIPGKGDTIYTPEFGKELYYWVPNEEATKTLVDTWLS